MNRRKALKQAGFLAGATVCMPSFLSLLQSCKNETRSDWRPQFFKEKEAKTISALVDMILPRTDTPGALDVKVDMFIDKVIAHTYDKEGQEAMRNRIAVFNAECKKDYGDDFINLGETERVEVLKSQEANSAKFNPGVWGTSVGDQEPIGFYRAMKAMAIWAYFTSEEMGEKVLSYDPIPGGFEPCKPISEVGNRWSL
ncbi:gluconate 2-dehydrogenase subunit 3 family protein [Pareuzebyella sediminis]|uniref:gluconate 2-dehydrogenase subunit 3 family protein n=1 Tax=Pareuzebyella sediminis TaxID=2607998 RepID=UPI0011EE8D07|nr:gluconate 2-dehydrogenase subunit 3 family protein [Pareuzebyella sediminis]